MKRVLIALLRAYKRHISGLFPPACRFEPTCSTYAIGALERFGVLRGSILAIWRVLRCNPFGTAGYDPVPESFRAGFKHRGGVS